MLSTSSKVIVVAALLALCSPAYSQQIGPSPTEPAGPVVKLSLIVVDSNNQSVEGIKKEEIRVVEDKMEQSIVNVERDNRPIDIVIAIDASGSFKELLPYASEAAKLIINNRRPTDEVLILKFSSSDQINAIQDFTTSTEALINSLALLRPQAGQSAVIDAIYVAADHLVKHNSGQDRRKALVIITDGEDRNSFYKLDQLLMMLREKGVQVFALAMTTKLDKEGGLIRMSPRDKAENFLKSLASETGGRVFFSKTPLELGNATEELLRGLSRSSLVTYRSSNNSSKTGFRKVDVRMVSGSNRKPVVARGYFFTPDRGLGNKKQ